MMTDETEAPKRIWAQDAEPRECNFIGGGWWDDSLGSTQYAHIVEYIRKDLCDAKDKRIEELERSEHDIACLLCDAYGAMLDWDEVLKERADHEAGARIAELEVKLAMALKTMRSIGQYAGGMDLARLNATIAALKGQTK